MYVFLAVFFGRSMLNTRVKLTTEKDNNVQMFKRLCYCLLFIIYYLLLILLFVLFVLFVYLLLFFVIIIIIFKVYTY